MQDKSKAFFVILAILAAASIGWGVYSFLKVSELETQVIEAEASAEASLKRIAKLTAEADQLQVLLEGQSEDSEAVYADIEGADEEAARLGTEKDKLSVEIVDANNDILEKTAEAEQLSNDIVAKDEEIAKLSDEIDELKAQIAELTVEIAASSDPTDEPSTELPAAVQTVSPDASDGQE